MQLELDMNMDKSKVCSHCGERKGIDDFNKKWRGHYYGVDHRCRMCDNKHHRDFRNLRKTAPEKPELCECCGNKAPLQLDHNHEKNSFRGWICKSCNVRVGIVERSGKKQPDYIYKYVKERK